MWDIPGRVQAPSIAIVDLEFSIFTMDDALSLLFPAYLSCQPDRLGLGLSVTTRPPCMGLLDIPSVSGILYHMSLIASHIFLLVSLNI